MDSEAKLAVKAAFDQVDTKGTGQIDEKEFKELAVKLGSPLTNAEVIKAFPRLDVNATGTIGFSEFYDWWHFGKQNKLQNLVFLKLKAMKASQKLQTKLNKVGGLNDNKFDKQIIEMLYNVTIGDEQPKSHFKVSILTGKESIDNQKEICQGLNIPDNQFSLVLKIHTNNAQESMAAFQQIFEQLQAMFVSMAPEHIGNLIDENLKIFYATPTPSLLSIGFVFDHELLNQVIQEYLNIYEKYVSFDISQQILFQLETAGSLEDLIASKEKTLHQLKVKGLSVGLDLKLSQTLHNKLRSIGYEKVQKTIEQNPNTQKAQHKKLLQQVLLHMLSGTRFQLRLNGDSELSEVFGKNFLKSGPNTPKSLQQLISIGKESGATADILDEVPIIQEIIDVFKNFGNSELEFCFNLIKANIVIQLKTEGVQNMVQFLLDSFK